MQLSQEMLKSVSTTTAQNLYHQVSR